MKCPIDQTELVISDRQGVEIDYCPTCRGVWLDRGELDKVIDRTESMISPNSSSRSESRDDGYRERNDNYRERNDDYDRSDERRFEGRKKKKKESFLGDLFDFG